MEKGENGKRQRGPGLFERWIHPPNIKRCTEKGKKTFSTPVVLVLGWPGIYAELAKVSQLLGAESSEHSRGCSPHVERLSQRGVTLRSPAQTTASFHYRSPSHGKCHTPPWRHLRSPLSIGSSFHRQTLSALNIYNTLYSLKR